MTNTTQQTETTQTKNAVIIRCSDPRQRSVAKSAIRLLEGKGYKVFEIVIAGGAADTATILQQLITFTNAGVVFSLVELYIHDDCKARPNEAERDACLNETIALLEGRGMDVKWGVLPNTE